MDNRHWTLFTEVAKKGQREKENHLQKGMNCELLHHGTECQFDIEGIV